MKPDLEEMWNEYTRLYKLRPWEDPNSNPDLMWKMDDLVGVLIANGYYPSVSPLVKKLLFMIAEDERINYSILPSVFQMYIEYTKYFVAACTAKTVVQVVFMVLRNDCLQVPPISPEDFYNL